MGISNLFSVDIVNNKRQPEFDLCKTICIGLMILCHVFYVIKFNNIVGFNPTYISFNLVRLLGAPFFMFSMGVGLAYTRKDSAKHCLHRGLMLLFMAYLLNFLREVLPWMLFGEYPLFGKLMTQDKLLMFLSGDILHFAGLAFLFFAIVKYFKWSTAKTLIITLFITAIGAFCLNEFSVKIQIDNFYLSFIGLFIPIKNFTVNDYVCYSFTNWLLYPVVGWVFGKALKRCKDVNKFYKYLFWIMTPIFLLSWAAYDANGRNIWFILTNSFVYHQQNPIIMAIYLNIIVVALSIAHPISNCFGRFRVWNIIKHFGQELPTLYFVSWVIIGWIGAWLKYHDTYLPNTLSNIVSVYVFVLILSEIFIYFKNKLKNRNKDKVSNQPSTKQTNVNKEVVLSK